MLESGGLVGSSGELDKVKFKSFELSTKQFTIFGGETFVLKLDAVDFDAENEGWVRDARSDSMSDVSDQPGAIEDACPTVLIGAFVGRQG